jgi:uncharacterized protein YbdZ (MbtH family)
MHPSENEVPYKAIANDEGYRLIWLANQELPPGWHDTGVRGTKSECLAYIDALTRSLYTAHFDGGEQTDHDVAERAFVAPRTPTERALAGICVDILHVPQVSVDDNFFDLGARSLHVALVRKRLQELFEQDVPLVKLFEHPTIESLAAYLDRQERGPLPPEQEDDQREKGKQRLKQQLKRRQQDNVV